MDLFDPFIQHLFQRLYIRTFLGGDKDAIILQFSHPRTFQFIQIDILTTTRGQIIFLFRDKGKCVHLIENHDHRFLGLIDLRQRTVHDLYLLLKSRV